MDWQKIAENRYTLWLDAASHYKELEAKVDQRDALLVELGGALRRLLEGEELDPSGLDVRYYITEEDWEQRIEAAKAAIAKLEQL